MSERTSTDSAPGVQVMRTPLGRARGLGSAKEGYHHWMAERVTSAALVPLTLWFIWSVVALAGAPYATVAAWMASPLNAVLMLGLVLTTFHHMHLGLQVVIEDYIHHGTTRLATLLAVRAMTALLALAGIIAVLKLAISAGHT